MILMYSLHVKWNMQFQLEKLEIQIIWILIESILLYESFIEGKIISNTTLKVRMLVRQHHERYCSILLSILRV